MRKHFNLSKNKSLRTLETTARSVTAAGDSAAGFLKTVLSTITSPSSLNVVITYDSFDVGRVMRYSLNPVRVEGGPIGRSAESAFYHSARFKVFGEMYQMRKFRLVLCADVFECIAEYAKQTLEGIVAEERKNGGLDYLTGCEPLITSERRSLQTRLTDGCVGRSGKLPIIASAL